MTDIENKLLHAVDLVYLPRIAGLLGKYTDRFLGKVLSSAERAHYLTLPQRKQVQFVAGRIAAKEALMKATGLGLNNLGYSKGLRFTDITLLADNQQVKPSFKFMGQAEQRVPKTLCASAQLSISHDGDYVIASLVALLP